MLLTLSKFIPVRFKTSYRYSKDGPKHKVTWWMWRDRIFRHRTSHALAPVSKDDA